MPRESKEQRKERQAQELWRFIDVLRRAGNIVEEEYLFTGIEGDEEWRFDIALPGCEVSHGYSGNVAIYTTAQIAIEIEGIGRGHFGIKAFRANIQKYGEAFACGWDLLRVTWREIKNGDALHFLAERGVRVEAKEAPCKTG